MLLNKENLNYSLQCSAPNIHTCTQTHTHTHNLIGDISESGQGQGEKMLGQVHCLGGSVGVSFGLHHGEWLLLRLFAFAKFESLSDEILHVRVVKLNLFP